MTAQCCSALVSHPQELWVQDACDKGLDPDEFVEDMKKKGIRVAGIGHRIKSKVLSLPNAMPSPDLLMAVLQLLSSAMPNTGPDNSLYL